MNKDNVPVLAVVVALVAILLGAWFFRWSVVPVPRSEGAPAAYMVDRLTGEVSYLRLNEKFEVKPSPQQ